MKKFLIMMLVLGLALMMTGCGDDDDNNNNGGNDLTSPPHLSNPDNFDFVVTLDQSADNGNTMIIVVPVNSNNSISTLELSVNESVVALTQVYGIWAGEVTGIASGESVVVSATINGTSYNETITIANPAVVDYPETWDVSEAYTLSWTLQADNMYQYLGGNASWMDLETYETIETDEFITLSPSDRTVIIPANWLDIPEDIHTDTVITLYQENWAYNNRFICVSFSDSENSFYSRSKLKRNEIVRNRINRVIQRIKQ